MGFHSRIYKYMYFGEGIEDDLKYIFLIPDDTELSKYIAKKGNCCTGMLVNKDNPIWSATFIFEVNFNWVGNSNIHVPCLDQPSFFGECFFFSFPYVWPDV